MPFLAASSGVYQHMQGLKSLTEQRDHMVFERIGRTPNDFKLGIDKSCESANSIYAIVDEIGFCISCLTQLTPALEHNLRHNQKVRVSSSDVACQPLAASVSAD